jgi:DNA-binding MarR family transcriptional regulator
MNQKVNFTLVDDLRLHSDGSRGRGLSETLKASLRALKEHGRELVFETRGQAVRSLMRGRRLDRYTAHKHVMKLIARGLIRFEKRTQEELQPRLLEIIPVEAG